MQFASYHCYGNTCVAKDKTNGIWLAFVDGMEIRLNSSLTDQTSHMPFVGKFAIFYFDFDMRIMMIRRGVVNSQPERIFGEIRDVINGSRVYLNHIHEYGAVENSVLTVGSEVYDFKGNLILDDLLPCPGLLQVLCRNERILVLCSNCESKGEYSSVMYYDNHSIRVIDLFNRKIIMQSDNFKGPEFDSMQDLRRNDGNVINSITTVIRNLIKHRYEDRFHLESNDVFRFEDTYFRIDAAGNIINKKCIDCGKSSGRLIFNSETKNVTCENVSGNKYLVIM